LGIDTAAKYIATTVASKLIVGDTTAASVTLEGVGDITAGAAISFAGATGTVALGDNAGSLLSITGHAATPGKITITGTGSITSAVTDKAFTLSGAGSFTSGTAENTTGKIVIGNGSFDGTTTAATASVLTFGGAAKLTVPAGAANVVLIGADSKGLILDVSGGGSIAIVTGNSSILKVTGIASDAGKSSGIYAGATAGKSFLAGVNNSAATDASAAVLAAKTGAAEVNTITVAASTITIDSGSAFSTGGSTAVTVTP
jgi:hypothetical protein